jgi:hypothetical protein
MIMIRAMMLISPVSTGAINNTSPALRYTILKNSFLRYVKFTKTQDVRTIGAIPVLLSLKECYLESVRIHLSDEEMRNPVTT